ncbi:hypothetical protein K4K49_010683 [Colletotrichum sp. SAR 10_70]|nr:hypothetical protein K4K50_012029 [Colletotrichum sp. SAR 10_71]KAI8193483.1 hypothetical protein K4K49_010683 [Colletotrichum sp. SAR 10_70]
MGKFKSQSRAGKKRQMDNKIAPSLKSKLMDANLEKELAKATEDVRRLQEKRDAQATRKAAVEYLKGIHKGLSGKEKEDFFNALVILNIFDKTDGQ